MGACSSKKRRHFRAKNVKNVIGDDINTKRGKKIKKWLVWFVCEQKVTFESGKGGLMF